MSIPGSEEDGDAAVELYQILLATGISTEHQIAVQHSIIAQMIVFHSGVERPETSRFWDEGQRNACRQACANNSEP